MSTTRRLTLTPLDPDTAEPTAREHLLRARAAMGAVPNMYGAMANLPALLDSYLHTYDAFRSGSGFTPVEQEVVFLTISRENACRYCMAAHSFVADHMSKVPTEITDAIRGGEPIPDAKLRALADFAQVMLRTRGLPERSDLDAFLAAGYAETQVLAVVLAIAVKTLSNYTNHVVDTVVDPMFAGRTWTGPTRA